MGSMSIIHWIILGALALLLFGGRGKVSDVMGDVAKGIKSFKKGLADDDDEAKPAARPAEPMRTLDHYPPPPAPSYAPPPQSAAQPGDMTSEPRKVG